MSVSPERYILLAEARVSPDSPAPVAWHFVLEAADGSARLDIAEEEPDLPGDRLELLALVRGLEAIDQPAQVTVLTPSRYVSHGLRFGLEQWRESNWQWEAFGQRTPVKHADLWQRVDHALTIHRVEHRTLRHDTAHSPQIPQHRPMRTKLPASHSRGAGTSAPAKSGVWRAFRGTIARGLFALGQVLAPERVATTQHP